MEQYLNKLVHKKMHRRTVLKVGLGAVLSLTMAGSHESHAQTSPASLFPSQPDKPWVEPTDLEALLSIAENDMGVNKERLRRIVMCESEGDPSKVNPSGARGLWQIMPVHAEKFLKRNWNYWRDWANGYRNTKIAGDIYQEQGLKPWDCRNALLIHFLGGV